MKPRDIRKYSRRTRSWFCKVKQGRFNSDEAKAARLLLNFEDEVCREAFRSPLMLEMAKTVIDANSKEPRLVVFAQKIKGACIIQTGELNHKQPDSNTDEMYGALIYRKGHLEDLYLAEDFLPFLRDAIKRIRRKDVREFASKHYGISEDLQTKLAEMDKAHGEKQPVRGEKAK